MKVVTTKKLPSGSIPFANVKDVTVRSVLMRMNENIAGLMSQLKQAQEAIRELQRRK